MNQTVRNMFRMRRSLVMAVSMMWVASAPAQTTATAERDPNFVGQGKDGVVTWTVNAAGIPQVHSFRYGDFNYIGFDKAGNSYLRATSRRKPIWSYHNGRAHELWEAPPNLMRPAPVPGGPTMAELGMQYAKAASAADTPNWRVQFTPLPPSDAGFDPNFYGAGESQAYFWGGLDEGRPQIYSPAIGPITYLGFDKATGTSYLQTPLDKKIYSYKAVPVGNMQQQVASAPANLSQPPSKKMRLNASATQQLQTWQKTSGTNKDPNFWGDGVDKYFEWIEGGETGPRIIALNGGNGIYIGFDETTGMSYLALGSSTRIYSTYKAGNGRPLPVAELPAHLINVPSNHVNGLTGTTLTTIPPGTKPDNGMRTANTIAHTGANWTVTFIDEQGTRQTLPMTRPNIVGFTQAMWEDANKNLGVGMWLASEPGGKLRIVVVEINTNSVPAFVDKVTVAPPATMEETVTYAATRGIVFAK